MPGTIAGTLLTSGKSTTDAASFTTASVTLTSGRRYNLMIESSKASSPDTPTCTGWTLVQTALDPGATTRATWLTRVGDGSTGTHTIDFGGNTQTSCAWGIMEWTGDNTPRVVQSSTTNGEGTSASLTLPSAVLATDNTAATVGFIVKQSSGVFTAGVGFTKALDDGQTVPTTRWMIENDVAPTDNVIDCTWATTEMWSMVGGELSDTAAGTSHALTGTVANVSTVAGALTVTPAGVNLSGTVAAVSSVAAAMAVALTLSGTVADITTVSAGLRLTLAVSGTVACVSTVSGALLSGTAAPQLEPPLRAVLASDGRTRGILSTDGRTRAEVP